MWPVSENSITASLRWIASYLYSYTNSASGRWLSASRSRRSDQMTCAPDCYHSEVESGSFYTTAQPWTVPV